MGRKKRKVSQQEQEETSAADVAAAPVPPPPPVDPATTTTSTQPPPAAVAAVKSAAVRDPKITSDIKAAVKKEDGKEKTASSHYAISAHSAEIVEEDIYISDGSEDEDDNVDVVLVGSKMGLMRRGLHQPLLVQPNLRQWVRTEATEGEAGAEETEEEQRKREEEELAKLDPAERAARLLAEKQRKLEEAKESARRMESEENAGRDPCLFSKRTAFDIRFDQIDDKPWERGAGEMTDFFNYGLTVDDWLEYAEQQLAIRQELTDANRQKRQPDPNIVPVMPRKPKSQTPKVAVAGSADGDKDDDKDEMDIDDEEAPVIGPTLVKKEEPETVEPKKDELEGNAHLDVPAGTAGAWGAGLDDAVLARLIEEQTMRENGGGNNTGDTQSDAGRSDRGRDNFSDRGRPNYSDRGQPDYDESSVQYSDGGAGGGGFDVDEQSHSSWGHHNSYGSYDDGGGRGMQQYGGRGGFGGRAFRGRGRGGGRFNPYGRGGRGGRGPPPGGRGPPPGPPGGRGPPPGPPPGVPPPFPPPYEQAPPPFPPRGRGRGRGGDFRRSSRDNYGYHQR